VIAANQRPDHCTIARFRQRHEAALAALFGEVLELCADAGLVGVAVLAVDGTKVHANASQHQNLDYDAIAREIPDRVDGVALAEVPGPPGAVPSRPFFAPEPLNNRLWHIAVNRLDEVNEQLVRGREDIYFGYEFAIQAGKKLPDDVIDYYVGLLQNPDSLRGSFEFYREWDTMMAQNEQRKNRPLTMPVLGIGGEASNGENVGNAMKSLANDVQSRVSASLRRGVPAVGRR
jgi:hypothetical protein